MQQHSAQGDTMQHQSPYPRSAILLIALLPLNTLADEPAKPLEIGSRLEMFVDHFLIDKLTGVSLALERPRDEGIALRFDKPWEGRFCGYATIIHDGPLFRF